MVSDLLRLPIISSIDRSGRNLVASVFWFPPMLLSTVPPKHPSRPACFWPFGKVDHPVRSRR